MNQKLNKGRIKMGETKEELIENELRNHKISEMNSKD